MIRVALAAAAVLLAASRGDADTLSASASVRWNNSLIVDIQVTTGSSAAQILVTYQTEGVDPLVSRLTPVATTGPTTITIGRLRATRTYTYTVDAIDGHGGPAGTASGSFTTGSLPPPLLMNTYTLKGRTTAPLVIVPHNQVIAGVGTSANSDWREVQNWRDNAALRCGNPTLRPPSFHSFSFGRLRCFSGIVGIMHSPSGGVDGPLGSGATAGRRIKRN